MWTRRSCRLPQGRVRADLLIRPAGGGGTSIAERLVGDVDRGVRQSPRLPSFWSAPRVRGLSRECHPVGRTPAWPHSPRHGACADAQPPRPGWGSGPISPPPAPRDRCCYGAVGTGPLVRPADTRCSDQAGGWRSANDAGGSDGSGRDPSQPSSRRVPRRRAPSTDGRPDDRHRTPSATHATSPSHRNGRGATRPTRTARGSPSERDRGHLPRPARAGSGLPTQPRGPGSGSRRDTHAARRSAPVHGCASRGTS